MSSSSDFDWKKNHMYFIQLSFIFRWEKKSPAFWNDPIRRKHSRVSCQNCAVRSRVFILHRKNTSCYVKWISRVNK